MNPTNCKHQIPDTNLQPAAKSRGLGRVPTLLGRGRGRWKQASLSRLHILPPPEAPAAPRPSELEHPSSRPSSELRREKDKDGERAGGGRPRPGVPRLHPWASRRAPGASKGTIADPRSPEPSGASRSRLPPELLQVQRRGGSSTRAETPGSGAPGGPGRWDRVLPPGRTQSALPGTAIHSRRAPPASRRGRSERPLS